jgi:hypothetical protein
VNYDEFLMRVIDDGLVAARNSYQHRPEKLEGAIAGFEACRGKSPQELQELLQKAFKDTAQARVDGLEINLYWKMRCYEAEIEWVCNVVSAILQNEGKPTIVHVTARAVIKAAEIVGVGLMSSVSN